MAKMIESRLNVRGHRARTYENPDGTKIRTVQIPMEAWVGFDKPPPIYRKRAKLGMVELLAEDYQKLYPRYTVPRKKPGGSNVQR